MPCKLESIENPRSFEKYPTAPFKNCVFLPLCTELWIRAAQPEFCTRARYEQFKLLHCCSAEFWLRCHISPARTQEVRTCLWDIKGHQRGGNDSSAAIAWIVSESVAKCRTKIKLRLDVDCRLRKRVWEQRSAGIEICQRRRRGTSAVPSATEWQQLSRQQTISSEEICMPACKLHKHQRVSSGLSNLTKRVVMACCDRRKSLSRYAVENFQVLRKRQQK